MTPHEWVAAHRTAWESNDPAGIGAPSTALWMRQPSPSA
jgi:hypothetical protein